MAGGEGTRLRPLTSNQPKPMVPIVGKPCIEHIVELLREHGFDDVIVTLAFMPQAIRGYFGDGEAYGVAIRYSVEESPAGTAGSVKLAEEALNETFLVISGDALCDIDLGDLIRFHREKEALVTIGLKSVPCIVQHVSSRDELEIVAAPEVRRHPDRYLKDPRPSMLADYFHPDLHTVMQVKSRLRQITVRVNVEESYVPAL